MTSALTRRRAFIGRLELDGSFRAVRMRVADAAVQEKIDTLSRRSQGRPGDQSIANEASNVTSRFTLKNSVVTYCGLAFNVQGATVKLDGTHSTWARRCVNSAAPCPIERALIGGRGWPRR